MFGEPLRCFFSFPPLFSSHQLSRLNAVCDYCSKHIIFYYELFFHTSTSFFYFILPITIPPQLPILPSIPLICLTYLLFFAHYVYTRLSHLFLQVFAAYPHSTYFYVTLFITTPTQVLVLQVIRHISLTYL